MDVPVNAELLRYGPEVQGADAMALLADHVVELEGRLAGLQAKRQRFAQSNLRDATLRDANLRPEVRGLAQESRRGEQRFLTYGDQRRRKITPPEP